MRIRLYPSVPAIVLAATAFALGQSGSTVAPAASPSPTAAGEDSRGYSESKSRPPRVRVPTERDKDLPKPKSENSAKKSGQANEKLDPEVLRVTTDLVTIPVSVFDRNGLYISGLQRQDFKIFEDGKEQEIAYFGTSDKPFTVALVLDVSLSTAYRIEEIRRAAKSFVDQLSPYDSVVVISFDHKVRVLSKATRDREQIFEAIDKAEFGSGTSLYDGVNEALRKRLDKVEGRKAVVLFTDGVDTTSEDDSYDSTLNYAEESDSLVFPIYYNTFSEKIARQVEIQEQLSGTLSHSGRTAREYEVGKKYLDELADVTGGRVFRPEATPGGLTAAFTGIAEELRRQYNIGYVPSESGTPGQRKSIKVRVNRPNLILRARDSYVVGSNASSANRPTDKKDK